MGAPVEERGDEAGRVHEDQAAGCKLDPGRGLVVVQKRGALVPG